MRRIPHLLVLPIVLASAGCFSSATLLHVKPDGSGTLEQRVMLGGGMLSLMQMGTTMGAAAGPEAKGEPAKTREDVFKELESKLRAATLGEGVTVVSTERVTDPSGFEGVKAIYNVKDVNQLRIGLAADMPGNAADATKDDPIRFELARRGTQSMLTVTVPEQKAEEKPVATTPPPAGTSPAGTPSPADMPAMMDSPQMLAMMSQMFQGAKISFDVEVEGQVVNTNSDLVSGSKVTLAEIDLATLLADENFRKKIPAAGSGPSKLEDLKGLAGAKVSPSPLTITFR
jgi:hypothetical protein